MTVKNINLASGCLSIISYGKLMLENNLAHSEIVTPVLACSLVTYFAKKTLTIARNNFNDKQMELECASDLGPKRYR